MCKHENFVVTALVNRLVDESGKKEDHFCLAARVFCEQCNMPFGFLGLPVGLNPEGAAVAPDGLEARLALAPNDKLHGRIEK